MRSTTIFVRLYNHAPRPPPIRSALNCNAAAASAATGGWRSWRRARTRVAAAGGVFPKIKAHPTDLGGATQERVPSSNSNASSSKAMQASGQAPQARAAASAARDYNIVTNMKSLCMTL